MEKDLVIDLSEPSFSGFSYSTVLRYEDDSIQVNTGSIGSHQRCGEKIVTISFLESSSFRIEVLGNGKLYDEVKSALNLSTDSAKKRSLNRIIGKYLSRYFADKGSNRLISMFKTVRGLAFKDGYEAGKKRQAEKIREALMIESVY